MGSHPRLLWVSLRWLSWVSQGKWERKETSGFCSGRLERRSPLVPGAERSMLGLAALRGLSSSLRGPAGPPWMGTGGSNFPSHPPRLNIISQK